MDFDYHKLIGKQFFFNSGYSQEIVACGMLNDNTLTIVLMNQQFKKDNPKGYKRLKKLVQIPNGLKAEHLVCGNEIDDLFKNKTGLAIFSLPNLLLAYNPNVPAKYLPNQFFARWVAPTTMKEAEGANSNLDTYTQDVRNQLVGILESIIGKNYSLIAKAQDIFNNMAYEHYKIDGYQAQYVKYMNIADNFKMLEQDHTDRLDFYQRYWQSLYKERPQVFNDAFSLQNKHFNEEELEK